jgi:dolichyl-phosphate-mannose--protein O-mannosyl transferase
MLMMNVLLAAGATGTQHSARLLAALLPLLILAVVFDVFCLIDLVRAKSVRYLPKVVWAIIIVLMSVPLGALLYLFVGRDPNQGSRARG